MCRMSHWFKMLLMALSHTNGGSKTSSNFRLKAIAQLAHTTHIHRNWMAKYTFIPALQRNKIFRKLYCELMLLIWYIIYELLNAMKIIGICINAFEACTKHLVPTIELHKRNLHNNMSQNMVLIFSVVQIFITLKLSNVSAPCALTFMYYYSNQSRRYWFWDRKSSYDLLCQNGGRF